MTHPQQFSSVQEERWSEISEFPGYSISDQGKVRIDKFKRLVTPSAKATGSVMVGLMRDGKQHKRSLALLVANHFVPQPSNESFDTPVHRNGDRSDCHYVNLFWRPLWFSRRYMRQFHDDHNTYPYPIEDVETHESYKTSLDASMINGVLDEELCLSMMQNTYVWPTGQVFRKIVEN